MPWSCRWSRGIPSSAATSGWWSSGTRRSSWMLLGGQSWRLTLVTRGEPGCGLRREWKVVVAKSVQHGFIYLCIHSSVHSIIHLFMHWFIHSFIHSCIHSFDHSFIHAFIHSFTHHIIFQWIMNACFHTYTKSLFNRKHYYNMTIWPEFTGYLAEGRNSPTWKCNSSELSVDKYIYIHITIEFFLLGYLVPTNFEKALLNSGFGVNKIAFSSIRLFRSP